MKSFTVLLLLFISLPVFAENSQIETFIQHMSETQGFNSENLRAILNKARRRQDIIDRMSKPAERTLDWGQYRKIFLTTSRITQGIRFWKDNQAALARAEREYGVPAQYIVAIIGVETYYGRIVGKDRVLDALYTLAFHYPKRSKFFTAELEKYLILTREENLDPTLPRGSYAGAMGLGQFMPSSYLSYAVDFNGDGKRDIWNNPADAIGSVANYFAKHGWQKGQPVTSPAWQITDKHEKYYSAGLKPAFSVSELRKADIGLEATLDDELSTTLIELATDKGPEYWAGLQNFYVITRYNHSEMYAMAVYQLGQEISARGHFNTYP